MRPTFLDPVLMGLFGAMAFFAIATDLLQATGTTGGMSRDDWSMLPVPSRWLDAIDWWFAHDLLLKANPLWYRLMAVVSPTLYLPFVRFLITLPSLIAQYAAAIYAFIYKREWIRIPAICWATALGYSMVIILAEEFYGQFRTPSPGLIAAAYGPYAVAPLLVLWRMWQAPVFERRGRTASPGRSTSPGRKAR